MTSIHDCSVESELLAGMRLARRAIGSGELVVIPTDTVYGVAADAFSAEAVQRLLDAKGRERTSPPPVLIPGIPTLDALAVEIPEAVRTLVAEFWPGGLTVILRAQPSLQWDLGETRGTVALRMPANRIALELLSETGPLAVSSANLSGMPSATTAEAAHEMLGDRVAVYLDGGEAGTEYEAIGERPGDTSSTIVDATGIGADGSGELRIVRAGVISRERIAAVVGESLLAPERTVIGPDATDGAPELIDGDADADGAAPAASAADSASAGAASAGAASAGAASADAAPDDRTDAAAS
ncbi:MULTISPECIES: L-threonylcarbamoyladenylate synthase [unclassified Agromyces]|uniref:L-threonylcarbamoyladenylate synthase n=1 Tax=unclassified Agromyces TaxID=2639701 RepID=UPI0007B1EE36|nr:MULTISPECIES: L-threonylcarbamoyladenylate synthase [unclassified Agromyces]KZE94216.1 putative threonylcarbamoyl-AMP synthase [Agromyces sp. NDB4Y10]MCK8608772.1 L-threonylcarbamoyladenylate synthase [Agromyces sp. C10]